MFGSNFINWAKEPSIADSISELRSDILGVLANLIIQEQNSNEPNYLLINEHISEMDSIDDIASKELYFKNQEEALVYVAGLKNRLNQLLEEHDRDFNSTMPTYVFIK